MDCKLRNLREGGDGDETSHSDRACLLLLATMACSFPGLSSNATPTLSPEQALTAAAETVQAILNQTQAVLPTVTPSVAESPTPPPATSTPSPSPTVTVTPQPCNQAAFVTDVTIPDGTELPPQYPFHQNLATEKRGYLFLDNPLCSRLFPWRSDGWSQCSATDASVVNPGETVDISVELRSPAAPGSYRGYWRLRAADGSTFGLTNGNDFWVDIKVVSASPTPTFTPTWALHLTLVRGFE